MIVPRPAASVILWRHGQRGVELYLVRRGATQRFAPGFTAFPGGRRDPEDAAVPVHSAGRNAPADLACAARELFEEAGVLVATGPARTRRRARRAPHPPARRPDRLRGAAARARRRGRRPALRGERPLGDAGVLRRSASTPSPTWSSGAPARPPRSGPASSRTAPGSPPPAPSTTGRAATRLFLPPNLWPVRVLARGPSPDLEALRHPDRAAFRLEYQQGLWQLPLRTPTLPPAAHTNCWIADLGDRVAVVDPGSPWPEEQARLDRFLETLAAEGRPAREVWLTHGHVDHVGGVAALAARGLAVRAHRAIAPRLPGVLFKPLRDGELLGGRYGVLFTPGHARDHVVFHDEETGALLVGDMLSTLSTIVIDPPEGDMAEYERQLQRLVALAAARPLPGPRPAGLRRGGRAASAYLAHRAEREARIVEALREPGTLSEITRRAYADVPPQVWPVAERSGLAVLLKLAGAGSRRGGRGRALRGPSAQRRPRREPVAHRREELAGRALPQHQVAVAHLGRPPPAAPSRRPSAREPASTPPGGASPSRGAATKRAGCRQAAIPSRQSSRPSKLPSRPSRASSWKWSITPGGISSMAFIMKRR